MVFGKSTVWYCFVVGVAIFNWINNKKIIAFMIILFFLRNLWGTIQEQGVFEKVRLSDDPKNMANLKKNIDWIYEKSGGEAFKAMNFVPEIFDLPQQYLYWWYGAKKYGYRPKK